MSTEQNKAIVRRFNKEFIEGGSMDSFSEIISPEFINHTAPTGSPVGPEGVIYFFDHMLRPAFPDLTVEIHDQLAEGDKVITRKSFHATHKAAFFGIPATGNKVRMDVIDIIRLRDGRFVEHWGILDMHSVIAQISLPETA